MTSKEALNTLYHIHCSNCLPVITQSENELWDCIKKDLDKLEKFETALNDIVFNRPILAPVYIGGDCSTELNEYIREIQEYINKLSKVDNIIVSAVYERYKREKELDK